MRRQQGRRWCMICFHVRTRFFFVLCVRTSAMEYTQPLPLPARGNGWGISVEPCRCAFRAAMGGILRIFVRRNEWFHHTINGIYSPFLMDASSSLSTDLLRVARSITPPSERHQNPGENPLFVYQQRTCREFLCIHSVLGKKQRYIEIEGRYGVATCHQWPTHLDYTHLQEIFLSNNDREKKSPWPLAHATIISAQQHAR